MTDPLNVLKKTFGYDSFRPGQEKIVQAFIEGRDGLVLMATSGGKSICYQIPGLCREGTMVVISPLISLMKDQVDSLVSRDVPAACINSSQGPDESAQAIKDLLSGRLKFIYISPEKLVSEQFAEILSAVNIQAFAIDEAHCVSLWGHDFRSSYTKINQAFAKIEAAQKKRIQKIAFTATANEHTQNDIVALIGLSDNRFVYKGTFNRDNIDFSVRPSKNKHADITNYVNLYPEDTKIIYTSTIKGGYALLKHLRQEGISSEFYHGKLNPDEKQSIQDRFMDNKIKCLVATNAFGMGVDKPDVRHTLHLHMPSSIENYYQEAGRAGRDGKPSWAVLFYADKRDRELQEFFIDTNFPEPSSIKGVAQTITALSGGESMAIDENFIASACPTSIKSFQVFSALRILQDNHFLTVNEEYCQTGRRISVELQKDAEFPDLSYLSERRKVSSAKLDAMQRFCETHLCKRKFLLNYLGEKEASSRCGHCSSCHHFENTLNEIEKSQSCRLSKISDEAYFSLLKLIQGHPGRFTAEEVSKVLSGVRDKQLKTLPVTALSSMGIWKSFNGADISALINDAIQKNLISCAEDGSRLSITDKGNLSLTTRSLVRESAISKMAAHEHKIDPGLFKVFQAWRLNLSKKTRIPAFMIMTDRAIHTLCGSEKKIDLTALRSAGLKDKIISLHGKNLLEEVATYLQSQNQASLTEKRRKIPLSEPAAP